MKNRLRFKYLFFIFLSLFFISCATSYKSSDGGSSPAALLKSDRKVVRDVSSSFPSFSSFFCPPGYSLVPRDDKLRTEAFCVMQFEAKAWRDKRAQIWKVTKPKPNKQVDEGEVSPNGCDGRGNECEYGSHNWGWNNMLPLRFLRVVPGVALAETLLWLSAVS